MIHRLPQLKQASQLQADKQWLRISKAQLLAELSSRQQILKNQQLSWFQQLNLFSLRLTRRLMPSTVSLVALFLLVSFGFSTSYIAQAAIPGDILYSVKITIEKAELALATNPVSETEISLRHVNNRLKELEALSNTNLDSVRRDVAIEEVVRRLERNMMSADSSLKIAQSSSNQDRAKTALVARSLSRGASAAAKALGAKAKDLAGIIVVDGRVISKDTKIYDSIAVTLDSGFDSKQEVLRGTASEQAVVKTLTDAIKVNEGVSENALNTAAELHQESHDVLSSQDLAALITETIADREEYIQAELDVIGELDLPALRREIRQNPIEGITVLSIDILDKNIKESQSSLGISKSLLEEGKLIEALTELDSSKGILDETSEILSAISVHVTDQVETPTATSTAPISPSPIKGSTVTIEVVVPTGSPEQKQEIETRE